MKSRIRHGAACITAAAMYLVFGSLVSAADVAGGANGISLAKASSNSQSLRVTGPNGFAAVTAGNQLSAGTKGPLADGLYKYEVTETQCASVSYAEISSAARDNAANGRDAKAQPSSCREVVVDSGAFRIVNGAVPDSTLVEE